jgi:hypothetical protein
MEILIDTIRKQGHLNWNIWDIYPHANLWNFQWDLPNFKKIFAPDFNGWRYNLFLSNRVSLSLKTLVVLIHQSDEESWGRNELTGKRWHSDKVEIFISVECFRNHLTKNGWIGTEFCQQVWLNLFCNTPLPIWAYRFMNKY